MSILLYSVTPPSQKKAKPADILLNPAKVQQFLAVLEIFFPEYAPNGPFCATNTSVSVMSLGPFGAYFGKNMTFIQIEQDN